jgi:SAM-dependent methyltransferase
MKPSDVENYIAAVSESRIQHLHPKIFDLIGDAAGLDVLDFGCGEGLLSLPLIAGGCRSATLIDADEQMVAEAKRRVAKLNASATGDVQFLQGSEEHLTREDTFDVAICSLVLMMIEDRGRLEATCRRLVLAVTHPCFREEKHGTFRNDLPADFTYWKSGTGYDVKIREPGRDTEATLRDFHWTLSDLINAAGKAGGAATRAIEIGAVAEGGSFADGPAYLVLEIVRR